MPIESELERIVREEPGEGDGRAVQERDDFARQKDDLEISGIRLDLEARKTYARRVFWLVVAWIFAVLAIVVCSGVKYCSDSAKPETCRTLLIIPDGVLIALITGLSVNVVALLAIVISYLFPKRSKRMDQS